MMKMPAYSAIQIRRATPQDAASVARVLHDAFIEFEPLYTPQGFAATTPNADQVLIRMSEGPVWIAANEVEVLGTVAAVIKDNGIQAVGVNAGKGSGSLYMRGMAVAPAARGGKVAARLLEEVERYAFTQNCSRIFLTTTPFLIAAIKLYKKAGFRRTEKGTKDLFGTPLFTMEKNISREK